MHFTLAGSTVMSTSLLCYLQALEKEMALGGELDSYEFEGPDRAEFLQDLAEFQLAAVRLPPSCFRPCLQCRCAGFTSSQSGHGMCTAAVAVTLGCGICMRATFPGCDCTLRRLEGSSGAHWVIGKRPLSAAAALENLLLKVPNNRAAGAVQRAAGEQLQRAGIAHGGHGVVHQERQGDAGQAHAVLQQVHFVGYFWKPC